MIGYQTLFSFLIAQDSMALMCFTLQYIQKIFFIVFNLCVGQGCVCLFGGQRTTLLLNSLILCGSWGLDSLSGPAEQALSLTKAFISPASEDISYDYLLCKHIFLGIIPLGENICLKHIAKTVLQ